MLLTINAVVAAFALLGAVLVARAYLPHIPLRDTTPAAYLARSFIVASGFYMLRVAFDLILAAQGIDPFVPFTLTIIVNAGVVISAWFALKARHMAIPEPDRSRYNPFTAIFYPRGLRIGR